jgi:hypothetical protein
VKMLPYRFAETRAALARFDAGAPERDRLWDAAMNDGAVRAAIQAAEVALQAVRDAFLRDTCDVNRPEHAAVVTLEFMRRCARLRPGLRVQLRQDVERFPHFIAKAGLKGTVHFANDDGTVCVRMDERLPGAEEWQNEVQWGPDGDALGRADDDVEVIGEVPVCPACNAVISVTGGTSECGGEGEGICHRAGFAYDFADRGEAFALKAWDPLEGELRDPPGRDERERIYAAHNAAMRLSQGETS